MKLAKKLTITLAIFAIIAFFWLREPALSLEAQAWLEPIEKLATDSPDYTGYYLWMGISAQANTDAIAIGRQRISQNLDDSSIDSLIGVYPKLPKNFTEATLTELIKQPTCQIAEMLVDGKIFIQRYQQIISQPINFTALSLTTPSPSFSDLKNAQKLQWLDWWYQLNQSTDPKLINAEIESQFSQIKILIENANFLIDKMFYNNLLIQHLKLHQELEKQYNKININYSLMNNKTLSLRHVSHGEFYFIKKITTESKKKPRDLFDILLKPNFLLNNILPFYKQRALHSELPPEKILSSEDNDFSISHLSKWVIVYDLNSYIAINNSSSFKAYAIKLHKTNCLIDSFNQTQGKEISTKHAALNYCKLYN